MLCALALRLLLSASPDAPVRVESYSHLPLEALLEQKRLLKEKQPGFIAPTVVAAVGLAPLGAGALGILYGLAIRDQGPNARNPFYIAGGALLVAGAAVFAVGIVWLVKRLSARTSYSARIEEVDSLIDLRLKQAVLHPAPVSLRLSSERPGVRLVAERSGIS